MKSSFLVVVTLLVLSGFANSQERIPFDDPYAARKVFYEKQWQQKIESALRFVDGAVVNVVVELTPEIDKMIKSRQISGDPVAVKEVSKVSQSNSNGRPGLFTQGPGRNNDNGENSEVREESQSSSLVPTTKTTASMAGLVPRHVRACVTIPTSYYEKLAAHRRVKQEQEDQVAPTDLAEIEKEVEAKVKTTVAALLPRELAVNSFSDVTVTSFEDLTNCEPVPPEPLQARRAFEKGDVITLTLSGTGFFQTSGVDQPVHRIAALIVDVKPNGRMMIEGKQSILHSNTHCQVAVSGVVQASSIMPDATVSSSEVDDLKLTIFETSD